MGEKAPKNNAGSGFERTQKIATEVADKERRMQEVAKSLILVLEKIGKNGLDYDKMSDRQVIECFNNLEALVNYRWPIKKEQPN